jgi:hypothetical protein
MTRARRSAAGSHGREWGDNGYAWIGYTAWQQGALDGRGLSSVTAATDGSRGAPDPIPRDPDWQTDQRRQHRRYH